MPFHTQPVTNGEFAVVKNVFRYYYSENHLVDIRCTKKIASFQQKPHAFILEIWNPKFNISTGKTPTSEELTQTLIGQNSDDKSKMDTKMIIVSDQLGVPFGAIELGWVVTVDKYQGHDSKTILLDIQPEDGAHFSREHGLVAISRAEDRLILFGSVDEISKMSAKHHWDRNVDLEWRLAKASFLSLLDK